MSKKAKELLQMDLYGLLGIDSSATEKQIKKAYRKKVLTCHPDKNPDNPRAAELFHQLSEALEVLTDAASKAAYDKICEAKKREAKRDRELDERRKKFKLDWEAKERQAEAEKEEAEFNRKREAEIIRLREETERMLEEQRQKEAQRVQRIWHQAASEVKGSTSTTSLNPVLKLRWRCKKGDETNGGYSQDMLLKRLNTFGGVLTVVVSKEKRGLALVEFANVQAAERIFNYEKGLSENPLKISWVKGQLTADPSSSSPSSSSSSQGVAINDEDYESLVLMKLRQAAERQKRTQQSQKEEGSASSCTFPCFASVQPKDPSSSSQGVTISHEDYESLVLMKLRQAAERQKQTQQMQKEDKEEGPASSSSFPSFASVGEVPVQRKKPPPPSQRDRESLADMEVRQAAERRRLIEKMQMEDDDEEATPN